MESIKSVYSLLSRIEKLTFLKIFILILIMTFLETFGVALVLPAVKVLISGDFYQTINIYAESFLGKKYEKNQIIIFGLIFISIYFVFKFLFVAFTIYNQLKFNFMILVSNCRKLYEGYLNQDYEKYTTRNPSLLVRNVSNLVDKFCGLLTDCFTILTDLTLLIGVVFFLLYVDILGTSIIIMIFTTIALGYYFGTRSRFTTWGKKAVEYEYFKFKFLYEGLTGLKDIRISQNESYFTKRYVEYVTKHGRITFIRNFIKFLPKQTYEVIAVFGLVILSFSIIYQGKSIENFLPVAGVFAVAAFKILPSGNRLLLAFQNLRFNLAGIKILEEEIDQIQIANEEEKNNSNNSTIKLENKISVKNISFQYRSRDQIVLENIDLEINKNQTIGIIGKSGSGKSTLMDLIIGLYKPTSGKIFCDNTNIHLNLKAWYKNIGYVPQNIQLFDNSIKKNIAFGVNEEEIDNQRIDECLRMTKLDKWIFDLPDKLETVVGDKGIRISGGQRQRIGIARALYNKPKILFFDESTSSLDLETEEKLMDEVNSMLKGITKVIISHRMSTLKDCDKIYEIKDKKISIVKKLV